MAFPSSLWPGPRLRPDRGFQVVFRGLLRPRRTRSRWRRRPRCPTRRQRERHRPPRPGCPRQRSPRDELRGGLRSRLRGSLGCRLARTTCEDRGVLLGLRLERTGEPGGLGDRGVEQVDGLAERREHRAGQLAQEHLTRLEVRQLGDLLGAEGLAVQDATLDDQGGVGLGKVTQTLGRLDDVALDEGDRGRTGQEVVEAVDPRILRGELGQRVLDHGVVGVLAEGAPQFLQLLHGETAVLGQHSAGGIVERVDDLRDGGLLLCPRHGSPSGGRDPGVNVPRYDERPGRRPRAWIAPPAGRIRAVMPLCHLRGSSAIAEPSVAPARTVTTTSGLWLRGVSVRRTRRRGQIGHTGRDADGRSIRKHLTWLRSLDVPRSRSRSAGASSRRKFDRTTPSNRRPGCYGPSPSRRAPHHP